MNGLKVNLIVIASVRKQVPWYFESYITDILLVFSNYFLNVYYWWLKNWTASWPGCYVHTKSTINGTRKL